MTARLRVSITSGLTDRDAEMSTGTAGAVGDRDTSVHAAAATRVSAALAKRATLERYIMRLLSWQKWVAGARAVDLTAPTTRSPVELTFGESGLKKSLSARCEASRARLPGCLVRAAAYVSERTHRRPGGGS